MRKSQRIIFFCAVGFSMFAGGPLLGESNGTVGELAALCRREAERFAPVSREKVNAAREDLRARLNDFYRLLTKDVKANAIWPEYLHWTETLQLLDASAADDAADRMQWRWQTGALVWPAPEVAAVAAALQRHVAMLRTSAAHESAEQHAAAWNQLADLIAASKGDQAGLNRIAEAVVARERFGDAPQLTASIRRSLSGPDMMFRASADWLQSRFAAAVDEPYQAQGIYSGMATSSTGRLTGAVACQLVRSPDAARWNIWFNGASATATTANGNGAAVSTRANTNLMAKQVFRLDAAGLAAEPTAAAGATALTYDQINAGGGRRQQIANNTVLAGRDTAERDTAAGASHALAERMDSTGGKAVARFNESYFANLRDPFTRADQLPPVAEFHSDESVIYGDWRWPQSRTFATRSPDFHSPAGLALAIDAAAIERFMAANIGGKRLSEEQFGQLIALPTPPPRDDADKTSDRWLQFAAIPCGVELADGRISLRFHVAEFESGGVRYPAMTAAAAYKCHVDADHLALVREGGFRMKLIADEPSSASGASGRQQTLQVAVRRFFNRALPERIAWPGPDSPANQLPLLLPNLQVKAVSVSEGWLQLGLATADVVKK